MLALPTSTATASRADDGSDAMASSLDRTWSVIRFTTGMAILSVVFVVSHGLLLVHELAQVASTESG